MSTKRKYRIRAFQAWDTVKCNACHGSGFIGEYTCTGCRGSGYFSRHYEYFLCARPTDAPKERKGLDRA